MKDHNGSPRGEHTQQSDPLDEVVIAVRRRDVRRFGAVPSIVLQQIRHYLDAHRSEWLEIPSEELARLSGLSPDQVRRAVKKLLDDGALEKSKRRAKFGDQTCSYRPVNPTVSAVGGFASSGDGDSANSRDGDSANSSTLLEGESSNPLTPLEGEATGQLFDESADRTYRKERQHQAAEIHPLNLAVFEDWWSRYPSGPQRGSRAKALKAWNSAIRKGVSPVELQSAIDHYTAARSAYAEVWKVQAPLMNGSTFLNSKRDMFDHEWTREEIEYWPPPNGKSWDHVRDGSAPVVGRDLEAEEAEMESLKVEAKEILIKLGIENPSVSLIVRKARELKSDRAVAAHA